MSDTGSPLNDERRDQDQGSVSLPCSHHASRSSTPGISSRDGTPRYLFAPSSLPRLRSTFLHPPDMTMAGQFAYHLAPARESRRDVLNFARESASMDLPSTFSRPQHPPDNSPLVTSTIDLKTNVKTDKIAPVREIVRLLRLQKYHQQRRHRAEDGLYRLQIAAARTDRLVRAARLAQHTLAECIKSEDKASFLNLFHALRDASDACLAIHPKTTTDAQYGTQSTFHSFMDSLSPGSKASTLEFLTKIRCDGTFVADHLDSLSQKELVDLIPDRGVSRQSDSVFGPSVRWSSRAPRPLGFAVDAHVDMLSSCSYASALETLVYCVRGLNGCGDIEQERSTNVWATVCARMISKQKPGSERIVPAILDIWAASSPWPAKERLELWMLKTLQEGSFLLDQPSKQTFRARVEGRSKIPPEDELQAEAFYAKAVNSLLDLLGEHVGSTLIPPAALAMCRAIWMELADSPGHQNGLPQFIATRWLCSSFLADILALPEAHSILTDHYVPEIARQRILREIATRTQKAVYEVAYSWKHGNRVSTEVMQRVTTVMASFRARPIADSARHSARSSLGTQKVVVISARDVVTCINALYPRRRPASVSSDYGSALSGLQSSASSISGFSLFRNTKSSENGSDVTTHWCTEPQGSAGAGHRSDTEWILETQPIREACLELEDLAISKSWETWAVLTEQFSSPEMSPMTECLSQDSSMGLASVAQDIPDPGPVCRSHSSALQTVKLLLSRLENTSNDGSTPEPASGVHVSNAWTQLEHLFSDAVAECESESDFVGAHFWFREKQNLEKHVSEPGGVSPLRLIFDELQETAQASVTYSLTIEKACEKWSGLMKSSSHLWSGNLRPIEEGALRLRDKMWYVADVRSSAVFDETRSITAALRVMGRPKRLSRARVAPPLRHWSGTKMSSTNLQLKSEAQILEMLSAKPEHGGANKLSDEQSRITASWLDSENIDNLCKGEERLHKFCMEIRKCVDAIFNSPFESSTISGNALFSRDEYTTQAGPAYPNSTPLSSPYARGGPMGLPSLQSHMRSSDALFGSSRALSTASSRDYLDTRSPTLTNKSSMPFWSPAMTEIDSPSSATSVGTSLMHFETQLLQNKTGAAVGASQRQAIVGLRERLTGLLLSDFSSDLFCDGSETDLAFWTGLGSDLMDSHLYSLHTYRANVEQCAPTITSANLPQTSTRRFDFDSAFTRLLQKFAAVCNPAMKLNCLFDIDQLLLPYMAQQSSIQTSSTTISAKETSGEASVRGFRHLLSQPSLRPATIFRDMQYIAALLPSSTLQDTPHGKAFCNAAVAIAGIKRDARKIMVETADSIIAYHSNNRGHGRSPSSAQQQRDSAIFTAPSRTSSAGDVARYSMADAAYLLQITAKEGDHVAQRELATLYLTHPELMDRIIAPFARPREVFREELEGRWRRNQDPNRCDPTTMCVAHHWMNLSSKGGDSLAKEYLRQREEMDSF